MKTNNSIHSLIKLRHLKNASKNDWKMLTNVKNSVSNVLQEADNIIENFGGNDIKSQYSKDKIQLENKITNLQNQLDIFYDFIHGKRTNNLDESFKTFKSELKEVEKALDEISKYPITNFTSLENDDWKETWDVIKSNLPIVQGLGESAFVKVNLIEKFSSEESDELTEKIISHIPSTFNIFEADKYKEEYLEAVKAIEKESNAKNNLWDRFLNVIAGNIPFKQTPEERVMMSRWVEGGKEVI